jgi:hypothetical protein
VSRNWLAALVEFTGVGVQPLDDLLGLAAVVAEPDRSGDEEGVGGEYERDSSGQASISHPCSRMSGCTPVAMGWSTARNWSTRTPCLAMIDALASTSSWVWPLPGDRVSVVSMNSAVRSEKSEMGVAHGCNMAAVR